MRRFSHTVGFDDAPFAPEHRGDVPIVGAVYAQLRLEGVLMGRVRRDGRNATDRIVGLIESSKFGRQLQLVLLQGIALAGFNVVDLHGLHERLDLPVLAVVRRRPRLARIRRALLDGPVPGGERKWRLIEQLPPVEPMAGVWVQRIGIAGRAADAVIRRLARHGTIPEPIRTAHLIAGALGRGESRGRT